MAVDVYSENMVSPRISFSHDLEDNNQIQIPCRLDHTLLDTTPFDFAFNVDATKFLPSSTADQLFFNGRILPTSLTKQEDEENIKRTSISEKIPEPIRKSLKEFLEDDIEEEEEISAKPTFWKFRRSNSLNVDKKKLIGSWKILSRSGSTGKFLGKIVEDDETEKPVSFRAFWKFGNGNANNKGLNNGNPFRRSSSLNCTISGSNQGLSGSVNHLSRSKSTGSAPNQLGKKGQIKNLNRNNVKVSPILNLPSPYISRVSVDLFGFGSLFCNGKDRKKKNRM